MHILISTILFIIGTILGSFYNVVGYRIPKQEPITFPSSHCPNCKNKLKFYELIPLLSFLMQKGKCNYCHEKISITYPFFELLTGILFTLSYLSFGLTPNLIIALTFISLLIIITISDYIYMIIPDNILIFFGIILLFEISISFGIDKALISIINGFFSFIFMLLLKEMGDIIFKKESMGGGDIKLLFILGMILTFPIAVLSIFVGSVIGTPLSFFLVNKKSEHIIPFGPFLAAGAIILFLTKIDLKTIINFYNL